MPIFALQEYNRTTACTQYKNFRTLLLKNTFLNKWFCKVHFVHFFISWITGRAHTLTVIPKSPDEHYTSSLIMPSPTSQKQILKQSKTLLKLQESKVGLQIRISLWQHKFSEFFRLNADDAIKTLSCYSYILLRDCENTTAYS